MDILGKFAEATIDLFDLYLWYIVTGFLIASWAYFKLSATAACRKTVLSTIFGFAITLGIIWLGFVSVYDNSYKLTETVKFSWLIIPAALLVSQVAICIILIYYKQ